MAREKELLHEWVETYTDELVRWAFYKVSDTRLAEDLVQDTFLAAAEKMDAFKGDSQPKTWLFSILNHKIIDHYRRKVKQPVSMNNPSSLSDFFDETGTWHKNKRPHPWHTEEKSLLHDEEFLTVLKECLDALPEQWSTCVKLKYLMEKKGPEICQELDLSPTNLWQIIHRARLRLRECLELNWFQN